MYQNNQDINFRDTIAGRLMTQSQFKSSQVPPPTPSQVRQCACPVQEQMIDSQAFLFESLKLFLQASGLTMYSQFKTCGEIHYLSMLKFSKYIFQRKMASGLMTYSQFKSSRQNSMNGSSARERGDNSAEEGEFEQV